MKILLVGGTSDGRLLATKLFELGFEVIYSMAGLVRKTKLPCEVVTGGFTQFGGLDKYVISHNITHLVDATHPFAKKMSDKLACVSAQLNIPSIRFQRQAWTKTALDNWIEVTQWDDLIQKIASHHSLFITAGQISQQHIDALARQSKRVLIRTAMPVKISLPSNVDWIKAIGPFELKSEIEILNDFQIDAIICKNSGGQSTYAKIKAAAQKNIPVYQFKRPRLVETTYQFDNEKSCIDLLLDHKTSLLDEKK